MKTTAPFFPVDRFAADGFSLIEKIVDEPSIPEGYVLHTAKRLSVHGDREQAIVVSSLDGKWLASVTEKTHDEALESLLFILSVEPLPKLGGQK